MLKEKVLLDIIKNSLIQPKDKIVVGVSGGPDSMCLLHILQQLQQKLDIKLIVAHINHQIREEAIQDEQYVKKYCEQYHLPIFIKRIDVLKQAKKEKQGIEETGRKVRYQFFEEVYEKVQASKIATAHNQNDKVETLIMNLLRGCGIEGLKSIEPKTKQKYIRPLLAISKKEIEGYCQQKQLKPCMDKTNIENEYTRNKVRNIVIPYLQREFNPNIVETLIRLSEIATEEVEYIQQQVEQVLEGMVIQQQKPYYIQLDLKKFNQQPIVIQKKMVFYVIDRLIGTHQGIEKTHIESILKLCHQAIGNKYLIPQKYIKISVKNKKVLFENQMIPIEKREGI